MALTAGARLGPYEVLAKLGEGGMGEVYRARDTKLDRDVALKILPESFKSEPDRLMRFEREAKTLAALNHPNIAAIYGIEGDALVMELVEGDDLSEHIARGVLASTDALAIARGIADALEAAHEHGIVHRDLKPANIKVRDDGTVKVLDFGLAKAADPEGGSGAQVMNSPTLTARATQMGMVLGTAAYMAPEQAKGKVVDKRADIWAFGCVLYEMLTGARAFKGDDVSETLASVLKDQIDLAALPASVPPRLRALIARCLERDVKLRLRDIGEARMELAKIADGHADVSSVASSPTIPVAAASRTPWLPWAVALVALVIAAFAGWFALGAPSSAAAPALHMRLNLDPAEALLGSEPAEIRIGSRRPSRTAIAISPNGQWLAFTGVQKDTQQLFLRDLRRDAAVAVAGTTGADNPFFSPDGEWIAFWSAGALRKVPVDGGPVAEICKTGRISGADWSADGRILFASAAGTGSLGIQVVSADGGTASVVSKLDAGVDALSQSLPRWIGKDQFLYTRFASVMENRMDLVVQRIDGTDQRVLVENASDGRLADGGRYLLFMRDSTLMAAPFDASRASLTGAAQGIVDHVQVARNAPNTVLLTGAGEFTISDTGTIVYLPGEMYADVTGVLTWLDRQGQTHPVAMDAGSYSSPRISPNGLQAVMFTTGSARAIRVYDFERRAIRKLPFDGLPSRVIWTNDGESLVFGGQTAKDRGLYRMRADGSGTAERLPGGVRVPSPTGWSADGNELVYVDSSSKSDGGTGTYDIFALSMTKGTSRPLVQTSGQDTHPAVSPDGRWLAYATTESGGIEVIVQAYDGGARTDISIGGGTAPRWTHDGKTLIYSRQIPDPKSADRARFEMWEVPLTIGARVAPGTPRKFADLAQEDFGTASPTSNYDVHKDGRILGTTRHQVTPPPPTSLNVITNWFEELRAKVKK